MVRESLHSGANAQQSPTGESAPTESASKPEVSNHVLSLQGSLRDLLGAKIDIRLKKNDAGQIVIHFGSNDDFERIVGKLRKAG